MWNLKAIAAKAQEAAARIEAQLDNSVGLECICGGVGGGTSASSLSAGGGGQQEQQLCQPDGPAGGAQVNLRERKGKGG